jgi:hypothetical protein
MRTIRAKVIRTTRRTSCARNSDQFRGVRLVTSRGEWDEPWRLPGLMGVLPKSQSARADAEKPLTTRFIRLENTAAPGGAPCYPVSRVQRAFIVAGLSRVRQAGPTQRVGAPDSGESGHDKSADILCHSFRPTWSQVARTLQSLDNSFGGYDTPFHARGLRVLRSRPAH